MEEDKCPVCGRHHQDLIDVYLDCEDWEKLPESIKITDYGDDFDAYCMVYGKQWMVRIICPKCGAEYAFSDGTL